MRNNTVILLATTSGLSLFRFISTIVLTRIFAPEAFALIGILGSITYVIEMLTDAGFRSYLLKHATSADNDTVRGLWTVKVLRGVLLTAVCLVSTTPLAYFLEIPNLQESLYIVSWIFFLNGLSSLAPMLVEKLNQPRKPILLDFLASALASVITLITAYVFESIFCVVIGMLYPPLLNLLFSYAFYKRPYLGFGIKKELAIDFWSWSKVIIKTSLITIVLLQLDKFLLTKVMTPEMLGLYFIAINISGLANQFVEKFSLRIINPALSKAQGLSTSEYRDHFYQTKHVAMLLASAALGIGIGGSEYIISIIYDDRYLEVSVFLSLILIKPLLRVWSFPARTLLVVKGYISLNLVSNLIRLSWILIWLSPAYYFFGYIGIIFAFSTSELPAAVYLCSKAYKKGYVKIPIEALYGVSAASTGLIAYIVTTSVL